MNTHLTLRKRTTSYLMALAEQRRQEAERAEATELTTPFPFEPGVAIFDINVVKFVDLLQVYICLGADQYHRSMPDTTESRELIAQYAANAQYVYGLAKPADAEGGV